MAKTKKNYFINKAEFHEEMVRYNEQVGEKKISNYIGDCILKICNGLSRKSNFCGYTYLDEMVSDGIENCIMAINNFDVENPHKNPFWYFSKIAYRAFQRRILFERKQQYVKHKNAQYYYLQGKLEDIEANEASDKVIGDFERYQRELKLKQQRSK